VITAISRFRVRNGLQEEVRQAFLHRPHLVEKAAGFCGLDVLTDAADPSVFVLLTRWTDQESFRAWHRSDAHHQSHALIPRGLKLDASFTSLTIGKSIEDPAGSQSLSAALEGQTVALSQWLMESDAVFALVLAPNGSIRVRNRAAYRIFPEDPAQTCGLTIWEYLVSADAERLRGLLSDSSGQDRCLLLNLTAGERNPTTVEVGLVRCSGAILVLGAPEQRHDSHLQTELLTLTNDLAVMMRETARMNRELKEANDTIERRTRTDPLTGLANRRTLDEVFQREIARAERQGECLSVIMADLDDFKSINDEFGHVIGDQVLRRAAVVFRNQLRPYDLAARYGGEEFILLLPGISTDDAIAIAERIRKGVAEIKVPGCSLQITVSLGVASWITGEAPETLVARADAALYSAKRTGRNRVEAATGIRVQESST
jgi:diguanylate cyclase (GGDEF)-like protein